MGISITNLNDIFEATKPSVIEYFQYLIPQEKDLSTWSARGVPEYAHHLRCYLSCSKYCRSGC